MHIDRVHIHVYTSLLKAMVFNVNNIVFVSLLLTNPVFFQIQILRALVEKSGISTALGIESMPPAREQIEQLIQAIGRLLGKTVQ